VLGCSRRPKTGRQQHRDPGVCERPCPGPQPVAPGSCIAARVSQLWEHSPCSHSQERGRPAFARSTLIVGGSSSCCGCQAFVWGATKMCRRVRAAGTFACGPSNFCPSHVAAACVWQRGPIVRLSGSKSAWACLLPVSPCVCGRWAAR